MFPNYLEQLFPCLFRNGAMLFHAGTSPASASLLEWPFHNHTKHTQMHTKNLGEVETGPLKLFFFFVIRLSCIWSWAGLTGPCSHCPSATTSPGLSARQTASHPDDDHYDSVSPGSDESPAPTPVCQQVSPVMIIMAGCFRPLHHQPFSSESLWAVSTKSLFPLLLNSLAPGSLCFVLIFWQLAVCWCTKTRAPVSGLVDSLSVLEAPYVLMRHSLGPLLSQSS